MANEQIVAIFGGVPLQNIMFFTIPKLLWFCGSGSGLSSDVTKTSGLMLIQIMIRIKGAVWRAAILYHFIDCRP